MAMCTRLRRTRAENAHVGDGEPELVANKKRICEDEDEGKERGKKRIANKSSSSLSQTLVTTTDLAGDSDSPEDFQAVKQTRDLFNSYYNRACKGEDERVNEKGVTSRRVQSRVAGRKELPRTKEVILAQRKYCSEKASKGRARRPDLVAMKWMKDERVTLLKEEKAIGRVRGILPGDVFFSRAELCILGLHSHWLAGIDYITAAKSPFNMSVCIAIIMAGEYEDDEDYSTEIWYTGQGKNDLLGRKTQYDDQEMKSGNLALKNCIETGTQVRVFRGHKTKFTSSQNKTYTFDGMYKVVEYKMEKGQSGFLVLKFKLQRLEGQPALTSDQVKFINGGGVPKSIKDCEGVVCKDLSKGKEKVPIVVTNTIDKLPTLPDSFEYVTECIWPEGMPPPKALKGCKCKSECNAATCSCVNPRTRSFDYVDDKRGKRLVQARGVVTECGPNCQCSELCINRNAQLGIRYRLEVFKTANKGWAVRSWDYIPAGGIVCFYVGRIVHEDNLGNNDVYVLDLDIVRTALHGTAGREAKFGDIEAQLRKKRGENVMVELESSKRCEWAIDAAKEGNVGRFFNHSCNPNLFYQPVMWDGDDINFAHPVLVAAHNIPPMTELTYDYGYELDSVRDDDGNLKQMKCYCGARNCSKRLY